MKLYDIVIGAGFVGTFVAYYANKAYKFAEKLGIDGELYRWTFGGLPEFFVGAVGTRMVDWAGKKIGIKNYATRMTIAATSILGLGAIDELVVNLSGGTQDPWDIAKYAGGVALSIGVGAMYNKKEKKKELKEQK